jgi:hypothetical protein
MGLRTYRCLRKISLGAQKHSIYSRNQPLCAPAIDFIIGSKSHAHRNLPFEVLIEARTVGVNAPEEHAMVERFGVSNAKE